jgi:hypothetical protein
VFQPWLVQVYARQEEAEIKAFMVFAIDGWISLIELKEIFLYAFLLLLQTL